jgi:hypothetical protein
VEGTSRREARTVRKHHLRRHRHLYKRKQTTIRCTDVTS